MRWALAIFYAAGIFVVSSIPGNDLPPLETSDKMVHALVFGGLAVLLCRALSRHNPAWSRQAVAVLGGLATVAYGCFDEVHQGFVSGRRSELSDVVADGIGALLAAWGWRLAAPRWRGLR